jgi:hypothetical protein
MELPEKLSVKQVLIMVLGVIGPLALTGIYAILDKRHEPTGAVAQSELRQLKREKRKLENYQRLAPNSEYASSREAEIAALRDEIEELSRTISD